MKRRDFLSLLTAAGALGAGASGAGVLGNAVPPHSEKENDEPFTLNYAPHLGLFKTVAGSSPEEQLRFMAERGFRALEDNGMRGRPVEEQERIAAEMSRLDMQMGVFVAHTIGWSEPNLTADDREAHDRFLAEIEEAVAVARRVNARWMTVVPGHRDPRLEMNYQTANVIGTLRKAAAILEPHGLVMVLEPLNVLHDHPGQFLTAASQAFQICKAVGSPSCKILYDVYHQQITEGNLIRNIDYAWDEIAYLQVGDNPGRNEPTTGEINYVNIFAHLQRKGYEGIIGMEHGVSGSGKEGEEAVIKAYGRCDPVKSR